MLNTVKYKDFNLLFQVGQGDLILEDEDVINQSIANILSTRKGSRVFNRNFGSNIHDLLFDQLIPYTLDALKFSILDALKRYEPRISLSYNDIVIVGNENDQTVSIKIYYVINSTAQNGLFSDIINLK